MSISLGRGLVPWLCGIFKRHPHRKQKNWDIYAVAWALLSTRHPNFPQICKLLLPIYP